MAAILCELQCYVLRNSWSRYVASDIWLNTASGNGLLPDGTEPLPEPMLTNHQWDSVAFTLKLV